MRVRFIGRLILCLAGLSIAQSGGAMAERSFANWRANCDAFTCTVRVSDIEERASLLVTRGKGPNAQWRVSLTGLRGRMHGDSHISLWVNGVPAARLAPETGYRSIDNAHFIADEAMQSQLLEGLRQGRRLAVSYTHWLGERRTLTFPLNGLAPSLVWLDQKQKTARREQRVAAPKNTGGWRGRASAARPAVAMAQASSGPQLPVQQAVVRGITTQSIAPRPRAMPALVVAAPAEIGPVLRKVTARSDAAADQTDGAANSDAGAGAMETFGLPGPVIRALRRDSMCDLDRADSTAFEKSIIQDRLDDNRTLYLLACSLGAYNTVYRIYIYDQRYPDEATPELFAAYSASRGWYGKRSLINADYDPETRTISAFEKGRGLGDCGSLERYKWTADGLRLVSYRYWGRCNGSRMPRDWPEIYRHGANQKKR